MKVGVKIDMKEKKEKEMNEEKKKIKVQVNREGKIYIKEKEIKIDEVVKKIKEIEKKGYEESILVRGEKDEDYGNVMKVMDSI